MLITRENGSKWRHFTGWLSAALMVISVILICVRGFNWGLDFTGGMVSEIQISSTVTSAQMHPVLNKAMGQDVTVISASTPGRWILRYSVPKKGETYEPLAKVFEPLGTQIQVLNTSLVGPQVGAQLKTQGSLAILVALLCIMGYLSFRFEWRLALGALTALLHDVLLVLGFFALTHMEFNLTVLAAILAILGYSLNDSIIIADRIREVLIAKPKWKVADINNEAIAATFSRTMVTSGTTLMTICALWILGGASLRGFAIAMFIGVLSGTWSSISIGTILPELFGLKPEHYKPKAINEEP